MERYYIVMYIIIVTLGLLNIGLLIGVIIKSLHRKECILNGSVNGDSDKSYNWRRVSTKENNTFIVSVMKLGNFVCSGAITSRTWVITSKSCSAMHLREGSISGHPKEGTVFAPLKEGTVFAPLKGGTVSVQLKEGADPQQNWIVRTRAGTDHEVTRRITYQDDFDFTIMLLEVKTAFTTENPVVLPGKLHSIKRRRSFEALEVCGEFQDDYFTLFVRTEKLYDAHLCGKFFVVRNRTFCASGEDEQGCSASSGELLIDDGVLIGVLLEGPQRGQKPEAGQLQGGHLKTYFKVNSLYESILAFQKKEAVVIAQFVNLPRNGI